MSKIYVVKDIVVEGKKLVAGKPYDESEIPAGCLSEMRRLKQVETEAEMMKRLETPTVNGIGRVAMAPDIPAIPLDIPPEQPPEKTPESPPEKTPESPPEQPPEQPTAPSWLPADKKPKK